VEDAEVESLRQRLLSESFPRLQMSLLVALAGLAAFLCSVALLHAGLGNMAVRYFFAAAVGYAVFLALVRAWLFYQERRWSRASDLIDVVDVGSGGSGSAGEPPPFAGGGGEFGGGGASGSFGPGATPPSPSSSGGPGALDLVPDFDDAWPLVLGAAALFAGLAALVFVVWASPILFAEVLLNAAVLGAVYRRARRRSRAHWLEGVVRRTWIAAVALCLFVAVAGFLLQATAPDARSLGAVLRSRSAP
jgi:uncharacterized membrane protein YgcG